MDDTPTQLPLGLEAPPQIRRSDAFKKGYRLFLAIVPDRDAAVRALDIARSLHAQHRLQASAPSVEQLHLSACPVGSYQDPADDVIEAVGRVMPEIAMPAFTLLLDRVMSFDTNNQHIVLTGQTGEDAFQRLHRQLALALRRCRLPIPVRRHFRPHMTLFYKGRHLDAMPLANPIAIDAREFVLVRSRDAAFEHLARWPLGSG